jgi:CheY-like chemotaxis protein
MPVMNAHAPVILIVDDDPDTCRNMADLFADLGYASDTAERGDIALEKARQQPYDLGLLDLRMPGMDGLTLCRHLKRLHPPMVAMIVTAYPGSDLDEEARTAGARHVLAKPVDCARLLALVGEALAQPARIDHRANPRGLDLPIRQTTAGVNNERLASKVDGTAGKHREPRTSAPSDGGPVSFAG